MATEKIILLTENLRLKKAITQILKKMQIEVVENIPALCDLNYIKTIVKINKNTKFIRKELQRFIIESKTTPLAIAIDYQLQTPLEKEYDPDRKRLCRTILISTAILDHINNLKYNVYNIIFIGNPSNKKEFEIYKNYPYILFQRLLKMYPKLESVLKRYIEDKELTLKLFNFDYLIIDETNDVLGPSTKFEAIIKEILRKKQSFENQEKAKGQTPLMEGNFEPARIIYKISPARLYVDGNIFNIENNPKFDKYKTNIIYIVGYFVNSTATKVAEKLVKFISEDLPKIKKVTPEDEIKISINSHTIVDGTTTPNLTVLFSTKLTQFKNIKILTCKDHYTKFSNSPGFISLKKHLVLQ